MSETSLIKYILKNTKDFPERIKKLNPPFDLNNENKVILFGAAVLGKEFLKNCQEANISVLAFSDNDKSKWNSHILGIKVIAPADLSKFPKNTPIIITIMHDFIIEKQLRKLGFNNVFSHTYFAALYPKKFHYSTWQSSEKYIRNDYKRIIKFYRLLKDNKSKKTVKQLIKHRLTLNYKELSGAIDNVTKVYFDPEIVKMGKNEIFVDGGAFTGDTLANFIKKTKSNFGGYYGFEPDKNNFKNLNNYVKHMKNKKINIFNVGLGLKNQSVRFESEGSMSSRITNTGGTVIKIQALDKNMDKIRPTFIKLDIEGFEKEALMGMKKIIANHKPKLAISVYHKPTDLWSLPLLIWKLNKNYKLYIRHYTKTFHETVCYAI